MQKAGCNPIPARVKSHAAAGNRKIFSSRESSAPDNLRAPFPLMKKLLLLAIVALASVVRADETGRLEVLFLGDDGKHEPAKRFFQALPALAPRGINLTYTARMEDVNPANLAKYDVLAIYANTVKLAPEQ